ncbi:MAG TPA: PadR family transcriptional regulator [Devosiaceae bacterium]|jgi:DNA-binding PadR family transcriptional regulator
MRHEHSHHGEPNWRRFEAMARRGWGRWGGGRGFGDFGGMGDNFRIGRMLASGDLRLVALYLIEQQPRHGYDLIKAIEEKSHGFYSPSPGVVYPALTFLEEAGYVTSSQDGNKKAYTITDQGRAHLADNRQAIEATLDFLGKAGERMEQVRQHMAEANDRRPGSDPRRDRDIPGVLPEVNEARRTLKAAIAEASQGDEATQRRLADILNKAAASIRGGDVDL